MESETKTKQAPHRKLYIAVLVFCVCLCIVSFCMLLVSDFSDSGPLWCDVYQCTDPFYGPNAYRRVGHQMTIVDLGFAGLVLFSAITSLFCMSRLVPESERLQSKNKGEQTCKAKSAP